MLKTKLKDREAFLKLLICRGFDTVIEFSKRANIAYSTMQQVTSGKRNPAARTAFKIAAALDMKFDDLFIFELRGNEVDGETQA